MSKVFISFLLALTFSYASAVEVDRPEDLNTAETFWNAFNHGRSFNTYSGWGTGMPVQPIRPVPYSYNGPYTGYGTYGGYASYPGYGSNDMGIMGTNYYAKVQVPVIPVTAYPSAQPTYENYAVHDGKGYGKYGNY